MRPGQAYCNLARFFRRLGNTIVPIHLTEGECFLEKNLSFLDQAR